MRFMGAGRSGPLPASPSNAKRSTTCRARAKPLDPVEPCFLAAQNLMLAADALGLGTCCIGGALPLVRRPEVEAELQIPKHVTPATPIVAGCRRKFPRRPGATRLTTCLGLSDQEGPAAARQAVGPTRRGPNEQVEPSLSFACVRDVRTGQRPSRDPNSPDDPGKRS